MNLIWNLRNIGLTSAMAFVLIGCSNEEPPPKAVESEPQPAAAAPANKKKSISLMRGNLAQADQALSTGQLNKAARELLQMKLQGKIRTAEDSWRYNQLMTELQSKLVDAAADGDMESQKTMQLLRASSNIR